MGLDKAIRSGKERRKPYYRSKRFDPTCRPGGSCPYCRANRLYQQTKAHQAAKDQLDFFHEPENITMDLPSHPSRDTLISVCPHCGGTENSAECGGNTGCYHCPCGFAECVDICKECKVRLAVVHTGSSMYCTMCRPDFSDD